MKEKHLKQSEQGHIALVGGTGFEDLPPEIFAESVVVETEFGAVSILSISDNYVEPYKLFFLSRHGKAHDIAPHQINFRANIAVLLALGVTDVIATNAVGSLRRDWGPGTLVLFDDFIDFTRLRERTVFPYFQVAQDFQVAQLSSEHKIKIENGEAVESKVQNKVQNKVEWKHVDFTVPYSDVVREVILKAAQTNGLQVEPSATYVCCDGPRFETPAEVRLFAQWGGDVVGMTGIPEVIFAKEAGLRYAALGIVTNLGAGLGSEIVDHEQNSQVMQQLFPSVREMLLHAAGLLVSRQTTDMNPSLAHS